MTFGILSRRTLITLLLAVAVSVPVLRDAVHPAAPCVPQPDAATRTHDPHIVKAQYAPDTAQDDPCAVNASQPLSKVLEVLAMGCWAVALTFAAADVQGWRRTRRRSGRGHRRKARRLPGERDRPR